MRYKFSRTVFLKSMLMDALGLGITLLSLVVWIYLLSFRGQFWRCNQRLERSPTQLATYPAVCAVIPARNEAALLPTTLRSLLNQDYPGSFSLVLVDDHSSDGTGEVAQQVAASLHKSQQLQVISAQTLPSGWTGKLWALEQGICHAQQQTPRPDYLLLTDADIEHDSANLRQLVTKAEQDNLALTSLMVRLRCESIWEKLLIPAFVFFFQKLYPFPWVNDAAKQTAAAAGGCTLIRSDALNSIGGIQAVRQALIDDCALAQAVKGAHCTAGKPAAIWLGLSESTHSLRPYPSLQTIWDMVARTAFSQLNYSPWLLVGTVWGMSLIYLVPPLSAIAGFCFGDGLLATAGLLAWLLMAVAYWPTLQLYRLWPGWALVLPAIAFFYTLMTVDSALRHWRGQGGAWKGRVYSG